MKRSFEKVLVANRGEIAVRIIRALREQNLTSVAIFSEADRDSLHVRFADEARCVGPPPSASSYLDQDAVIAAARKAGADAVHPGYGFLSENASFARACEKAGLVFIGPSADTIALMGNKLEARATAKKAGVPVIPGSPGPVNTVEEAVRAAEEIGFPIMLKAAAGGGGKGMRVVRESGDLKKAFSLTRGESENAFGDGTLYMERFIDRPRHIEMQILGDGKGGVLHFGERECSLQRRHQKVVEEAPSLWMTPERREAMGEAAIRLAREVKYRNAGTIEFIADSSGAFYFLEMNTRLQVEHPVTEMVYGVDLVREQIRMARGEPLPREQSEIIPSGWALECRLYAEDPYNRFLPSLGTINRLRLGSGPGVRNDMGIFQGYEVPRYYDPMLGKIIAYGPDRETARRRMLLALRETVVKGVRTNIAFHRWILKRDEFIEGEIDTHFIEREFTGSERPNDPQRERAAIIASVIEAYEADHRFRAPRNENQNRSRWRWMGRPGAMERERG